MNLPSFIIVGAAKSATSSLFTYIGQHPDIDAPKLKEPRFLTHRKLKYQTVHPVSGRKIKELVTTEQDYLQLFDKCRGMPFEASTEYLYAYESFSDSVRELWGDANRPKLIAILRNPVSRAWSNYSMHRLNGVEPLSFLDAIEEKTVKQRLSAGWPLGYDYIGFGFYSAALKYLSSEFDIYIATDQQLFDDPQKILMDICDFLEVSHYKSFDTKQTINFGGTPKKGARGFLANQIYQETTLKRLLRPLLSKIVNSKKIREMASKKLLEKDALPANIREILEQIYHEEIIRLKEDFDMVF